MSVAGDLSVCVCVCVYIYHIISYHAFSFYLLLLYLTVVNWSYSKPKCSTPVFLVLLIIFTIFLFY